MRQKRPVGVSPLARLIRGLRPDRNPLRRANDRVEAAIVAGLVAGYLIGAPIAAVMSEHLVSAAGLRAEQMVRYKVQATLLENALASFYSPFGPAGMPALARWTAPDGSPRTGLIKKANLAAAPVRRSRSGPIRPVGQSGHYRAAQR